MIRVAGTTSNVGASAVAINYRTSLGAGYAQQKELPEQPAWPITSSRTTEIGILFDAVNFKVYAINVIHAIKR
jgi:hypothetical protein